jgi:hypothetical protein
MLPPYVQVSVSIRTRLIPAIDDERIRAKDGKGIGILLSRFIFADYA